MKHNSQNYTVTEKESRNYVKMKQNAEKSMKLK